VYWTSCCPHANPIFLKFPARHWRLSVPVIETRRRDRRSGLGIPVRAGDYPKRAVRLCDTSSCLFSGYPGLFPGIKRLGHDVDPSPPFGTVVKNDWVCTTALHPASLPGMDGIPLPLLTFDSQQGVVLQLVDSRPSTSLIVCCECCFCLDLEDGEAGNGVL
jgi:hypothetical protein